MSKDKASAYLKLEFDGLNIEAWAESDGDIYLKIGNREEVVLSPHTSKILALALEQLAKPEED